LLLDENRELILFNIGKFAGRIKGLEGKWMTGGLGDKVMAGLNRMLLNLKTLIIVTGEIQPGN
jgi:hypothetical protein